jgi:hypothetical protein
MVIADRRWDLLEPRVPMFRVEGDERADPRVRGPVYEAFWRFASERQLIFDRRWRQLPQPWTSDPILQQHKFCNVFRAADRVSQFLIREVIYAPLARGLSAEDTFLRIILFRLFSKPSTWQLMESTTGLLSRKTLDVRRLASRLEAARQRQAIYTSAFILCAYDAYGFARKHLNHLTLVKEMFAPYRLGRSLARARSLKDVYDALLSWPMLGPFMSYQLAIDLNYSEFLEFSEDEFTMPGPGARRGIAKVFHEPDRVDPANLIYALVERQEAEFDRYHLERPTLFGRRLHAIDVQGLLCEIDKYARVAFPELRSNRIRIKHQFHPSSESLLLYFPPKWRLNPSLLSDTPMELRRSQLPAVHSPRPSSITRIATSSRRRSNSGTTRGEIIQLLDAMHRPKDRAYGDAWRRREEVLGIFANIARKVDRLEVAMRESDVSRVETLAETAADLAVYAGKYLTWLAEMHPREFTSVLRPANAKRCSAVAGPDALLVVLDLTARWEQSLDISAPRTLREAWARARRSFRRLETGLMAQAEGSASAALTPTNKVSAAWALLAAVIWLLVRLGDSDPSQLKALAQTTAAMSSGDR